MITMRSKHKSRLIGAVVLAGLMAVAASAQAEDVFVQQPTVVIRAGKGAAYEEVATVRKGEKLSVMAREGKWLKVKVGAQEGYVFENSISARNTGRGGAGGLSSLMAAGSGTSAASVTAAGKGGLESEQWARSSNMNTAGLQQMFAMRARVTGQDFEEFTQEGKVGPAKQ
jgi:uncharacterized protein YraI